MPKDHRQLTLVIIQVLKEWSCSDDKMITYYLEIQKLEDKFNGLEFIDVL